MPLSLGMRRVPLAVVGKHCSARIGQLICPLIGSGPRAAPRRGKARICEIMRTAGTAMFFQHNTMPCIHWTVLIFGRP